MPKPLRQPQPSSSIARLLDIHAAARAVAPRPLPVEPRNPPYSASQGGQADAACPGTGTGETPRIKRELILTPSTDAALSRLVALFRETSGAKLTTSHVARAVLQSVTHNMSHLETHAKKLGPLKLPSNARGREPERERLEARIADTLIAAIRASTGSVDGLD
ncbi:MAG: hypothetical protein HY287_03490 [Planctomycetes bacterium]|nr:hypothetical protein [Planctomycetota bacterium]MBI3833374.1 hypothetical protein [Planctomycetota bacterium]